MSVAEPKPELESNSLDAHTNEVKEEPKEKPKENSDINQLLKDVNTSDEDSSDEDSSDEDTDDEEKIDDNLTNIIDSEKDWREKEISYNNLSESKDYSLKTRNEIYYNLWKEARDKVKEARDDAIKAYLEAKNIKSTYLLDDIYEVDEFDEYLEKMTNE